MTDASLPASPRIFMLAGEPSGDMLGGRLISALRARTGDSLELFGVGGARMREQGLKSLFPMDELSLFGFAEVLPHLPRLAGRLRQTAAEIARRQPDLVLTIDAPGFALRLQRRLSRLPLLRVHYVAPQVWAWRAGRATQLTRNLDHLLALLPFEPAYFERHGLACSFVGHPIIEEAGRQRDGPRFRRRYEIPDDAPLLCLLPGSRRQEIGHHLPVLKDAVALLWQQMPRLRVVLPTLGHLAGHVRGEVANWSVPVLVLEDREERFEAYAASWLAIAASGTVSLELALAGTPFITIYKTGPLTGWLARRLITVPHVNLVNLILNRPAVPEFLQEDCRPERIAATAARLMMDQELRRDQEVALAEAVTQLGAAGESLPSERAAARILEILATQPSRRAR
jgi:lipid-A-disaccharide synthase